MMDVSSDNAVIAMHPVMHSRDRRVRSSGTVTINGEEPKRVIIRTHTGNYVGSSKSMEAEGTHNFFEQMGTNGRQDIAALVSDEDGGFKKIKELHSDLSHVPLYVDPGHYAKNRKKEANAVCAAVASTKTVPKRYKRTGERVKRWILAAISYATNMDAESHDQHYESFRAFLGHFHYFCSICAYGFPCKYAQGKKKNTGQMIQIELRVGLRRLMDRAGCRAVDIVHGLNTCGAESFNSFRTVLTPKRNCFWESWTMRCFFRAAVWNDGKASAFSAVYSKLHLNPFQQSQWESRDKRRNKHRMHASTVHGKVLKATGKRTHSDRTRKESAHEKRFLLNSTYRGCGGYEPEKDVTDLQ